MFSARRGRYFALLFRRRPAQERVVADGVLHVDDHARRGIDRRELLHRQHALEEGAALPAVLLGDFDAHQAHLEELPDDVLAEDAGLVHLAHIGARSVRARTCARWSGKSCSSSLRAVKRRVHQPSRWLSKLGIVA